MNESIESNESNNSNNSNSNDPNTDESTTNTDSSTDEKSFNKKVRAFFAEISQFLIQLSIIVLCIIIYFLIGSSTLYGANIGFSNILPTDPTQFPYTNDRSGLKPNVESNIFNVSSDPPISSKMQFPFDKYNTSNLLLNWTRTLKDSFNSNDTNYFYYLIMNYFTTIYVNIVNFNYTLLNFNFNLINSLPTDLLKILFGPIIFLIITAISSTLSSIYFIFSWFYNLLQFLDFQKSEKVLEKTVDYKGLMSIFNPIINLFSSGINIYINIVLLIIMFIMFFVLSPITFPILFIIVSIVNTSWVFYKSTINNKPSTIFKTIMTLLNFYKFWIMGAIILCTLGLSYLFFGYESSLGCLLSLIMFFVIYTLSSKNSTEIS